MIAEILDRAFAHDMSKLVPPEKEVFDSLPPPWAAYGTPAYEESRQKLMPALEHHYLVNSHHVEHYRDGIRGVNLFDLLEMLADWKSKEIDSPDNSLSKSIEINSEKYEMSDQLKQILLNTASYLEWI